MASVPRWGKSARISRSPAALEERVGDKPILCQSEAHVRFLFDFEQKVRSWVILLRSRSLSVSFDPYSHSLEEFAEGAPNLLWRSGPGNRREWFNKAWLAFTGHHGSRASKRWHRLRSSGRPEPVRIGIRNGS